DAERSAVADELFGGIGAAVVSHGPGGGPVPQLFQTGASVFVGRLNCERGVAGRCWCHDLRQYRHDDYRFFRAVWDRLVLRTVTQKVLLPCRILSVEFYTEVTPRSEEHTSELQSRGHLVCRLLLEKKNRENHIHHLITLATVCTSTLSCS